MTRDECAAAIAATFARDAAFFAVIARHGFRPVVWAIKPEDEAALAERITQIFRGGPFDTVADTRTEARKQADGAVLAAIRRSGR
jgi:hypothetical protein